MSADLRMLATLGHEVREHAQALNLVLGQAQSSAQYYSVQVQQQLYVGKQWPRPWLEVAFRLGEGAVPNMVLQHNLQTQIEQFNTACGAAWQAGLFVAVQVQAYQELRHPHPGYHVQVAVLLDTRSLTWQPT